VAEQDPPPESSVDQGTTVYVKLSRGSAAIDLTSLNLVGTEADAAEQALAQAGLVVTRTEAPSPEVEAGLVVGTEPAERAVIGETVTLVVSLGDVVQIPGSLQGQPVAQATNELEAAGLVISSEVPVSQATIAEAGVDLAAAGIEPGDVVGVQGEGADFGAYLPRGTEIELVVYDDSLDDAS
jgi:hypothetical protein